MNEKEVQAALDQVAKNIKSGKWGTTMFALITFGEQVFICFEGYNPNTGHWDLSLWKGCCDWPGLKHPDGPRKSRITSIAFAEAAVSLNPGMEIIQTDVIKEGQRPVLSRGDDDLPLVKLLPGIRPVVPPKSLA